MSARRAARIKRGALAVAQAGLGIAVVAGVAWAGTQPVVTDRIDRLDLSTSSGPDVEPGSTTVALERAVLVCPGPELLGLAGARAVELETAATVTTAPEVVRGTGPAPQMAPGLLLTPLAQAGTAAAADAAAEDTDTATGDADSAEDTDTPGDTGSGTTVAGPVTGAGPFAAVGLGGSAPGLVATQETSADTEEVFGLASTACRTAAPFAWLLGGGGGPGRAERIILTNPGSNPVTATVTVYGVEGRARPPDGQDVVVPAQGRTVLLGDALAPDEASPAFEITVSGGDAVATLVETVLDGTAPTGFDTTPSSREPQEEQVIPGVLAPAEGAGSLAVRIVNPGADEAIATIAVLTSSGELTLPDAVVRVPAESVVDVPLEAVPPGPTSLVVAADTPVVAAARTVARGANPTDSNPADSKPTGAAKSGAGIDSGWAVGQSPITDWVGAALPARDSLTRRLVLAARDAGSQVEVVQQRGAETVVDTVLVPTDGTVVVPLEGEAVWVRPTDGAEAVFGAVLSTAAEGADVAVSVLPLVPPQLVAHRSEVVPLG